MGNGGVLTFGLHMYEQMFNPPCFLAFLKNSFIRKLQIISGGFSFYEQNRFFMIKMS
jgi:hypothetical protein